MSVQQEPGQYQPAFTHLLPINDYEQTVESPEQQTPQRQELPLQQIEQILAQSSTITNRREIVLVMAINYLQQRCGELINSNNYLQLRQKDLMDEINYLNEVEINQEIAHNFLQVMQKEIENYKADFHLYRERYLTLKRTMFDENARLNVKIQELEASLVKNQAERQGMEEEKNDILLSNEELLEINANLNDRIEDIQSQLSDLKNQSRYFHGSRPYSNRKLDGQIQAQLQSLIDKLMQELQSERNQKMKISSECKLLQRQLMQLEKELTEKNSKIYQLEMLSIKSNRVSPQTIKSDKVRQIFENNHKYYETNGNTHKERNANDTSKRIESTRRQNENSNFKTFSLMTLLNQDADFSKKTRLIIALKVIQFYVRKIKKGDYTTQMLENLLVYNYSSLYPQACIIRKDKSVTSNEGECSQERLIWNLGFILDNLINQAEDEPQQKTRAQIELINLINNILQQNSCDLQDVDELKILAQEAIRLKK